MHYHFLCKRIFSGEVELHHVQTPRQVANIFTKALRLDKFWRILALALLGARRHAELEGETRGVDNEQS